MTRDTCRVHDGRDPTSDGEVYAALWTTAEFPRLPEGAPPELRKLAIEINDPKRVYAIHRASRRHHFQSLVERLAGMLLDPSEVSNLLFKPILNSADTSFKSDMAANRKLAPRQRVSLVVSVLLAPPQFGATMPRVLEPLQYTWPVRIIQRMVSAITLVPSARCLQTI